MFDTAVVTAHGDDVRASAEAFAEWCAGVPDPEFDAAWQRLLDESERVPGWADDAAPEPAFGEAVPSGWSARALDTGTADASALSDAGLIEGIVGFDRLASWAAARQARLLAELARRRGRDPVPDADGASVASTFAPDEVAVALHLARGTAAGRIGTAQRLLQVLPATHAMWEAGRIDTLKARAVDEVTAVLSDEHAAAVEARVLPRAPEQTLAQLRASLARAVIAVDPGGAAERHRAARRDRRVCLNREADGMASLWALLPAPDAAGAYTWLTRLARGIDADDPRSMDARRADLMVALLTGRLVADADITRTDDGPATGTDTGGRQVIRPVAPGKPLVQVVVPRSTLIGADDGPADLVGHGPIPADLAREIAAEAVWRRLVTDPLSGTLLDHGRTTYVPPAGLADHIRARDLHCRFPGCRRRAADADLDHARAWVDGGTTSAANLHALCRHHHTLKHHGRWRIESHPDGRLTWITPTGHRHTTAPHDYRPEPGPDPPAVPAPDSDPPPF